MIKNRIAFDAYETTGGMVLGFHGCDKDVALNVLCSGTEHLKPSVNDYDWLGNGIYFWLNDPVRAFEWAEQEHKRKPDKIKTPYVIGAVIELGTCLNLAERFAIRALQNSYKQVRTSMEIMGLEIPINKSPDAGGFMLRRPLDCAVINNFFSAVDESFDTVYGYFQEGKEAYPGAGIQEKSHIQICVRNEECIKGYFLPRLLIE